jgi:hypothetical protein
MLETAMTKMTKEQMQADWNATRNIAERQERLKSETDEGRSSILTQLLADEFTKFKTPQSGIIASDHVTVDIGNPVMGFVFGVLLIAATTGSVVLWESFQGSMSARAAVIETQNR